MLRAPPAGTVKRGAMRNSFDPYSEWLGINSQGLHPDRYQLLGLQRFENDLGVISAAARRQVAAMRPHENGPQSALAKKVLDELETARVCLSDPGKKQSYDSLLRQQMAARAAFPPGDAREDWAIFRALSDVLGQRLPYDSLAALRRTMFAAHPHLARIDEIAPGDAADIKRLAQLGGTAGKAPFKSPVTDFYLTNPIARASAVMAECSALAEGHLALTAAE